MPVTDLLRRNAREHGEEVALIELNPTMEDTRKISFKEFDLVQQTKAMPYRHEITWQIFDEKSNRVANMLLGRGIKKGDKVAILMFNCLSGFPSILVSSRQVLSQYLSISDIRQTRSHTAQILQRSP